MSDFDRRVDALPRLGLGISTEYGAGRHGLDVRALRERRPDLVQFLEIGADLERGIDDDARAWVDRGWPTTWHFLDVNLEEPESIDPRWIADTAATARAVGAAWLCGDAGLWYVGARDRGHGVLQPPILCAESASRLAEGVARVREG